jgi:hypothetical protein
MRLVIDDNDKMPLSKEVRSGLDMSPATFSDMKATFKRAIQETSRKSWKPMGRPGTPISGSTRICRRWPTISITRWIAGGLYRSARTILSRATQKIESGTLSLGSDEYRKHKRNQDQATRVSSICCATI